MASLLFVYQGFHSMPTIEISMTKSTWESMPADLQGIMERAVRKLAFQKINQLAMKDLQSVAEALQTEGLVIHNWSAFEWVRFRKIAVGQRKSVAEKSDNADIV
jgi:TRAP-type mannitol/chloroaromatic compound transport system substrate-binding protein